MVSWGLMCISDMHAPHLHHAATDIWKPGFMDLENKPEYVIVMYVANLTAIFYSLEML